MKPYHLAIMGVLAITGAGVGTLLTRSRIVRSKTYRNGLIVGDSLSASPVLTRTLTQLTHIHWVNVAIPGRNSRQVLQQVQESLHPEHYDIVVVSAGGNDGERSLEWTQQNLRGIVALAQRAGADVVLFTEPPFRAYRSVSPAALRRSEASRAWALGGGTGARYVVDLHRVLGNGNPQLLPSLDAGDGLHPNRTGQERIAQAVADKVAQGAPGCP